MIIYKCIPNSPQIHTKFTDNTLEFPPQVGAGSRQQARKLAPLAPNRLAPIAPLDADLVAAASRMAGVGA